MALIRLTDNVSINPVEVTSVETDYDKDRITVQMKDGNRYTLGKGYGQTLSQTSDAVINRINEAARIPDPL
jgi:hypothetical protein